MKTIWKFPCPISNDVVIHMPAVADILCVQVQHGDPCIWALVEDDSPVIARRFTWRGTGHDCDGLVSGSHVGTVQMHAGQLVFHLFEILS